MTDSDAEIMLTVARASAGGLLLCFAVAGSSVSAGLMLTDRAAHFLDDQLDVALRIGPLPDSRLVATRLGEVRYVVCASPAYLAAKGIPAEPAEIARHSVISFESVSAASAWTFRTNGEEAPVSFRSRGMQVVLQDFEPAARPVHLVYAQQSRLPLKLRAFVDFAVPRLREQLRPATL